MSNLESVSQATLVSMLRSMYPDLVIICYYPYNT